jgi:hypothetical protein
MIVKVLESQYFKVLNVVFNLSYETFLPIGLIFWVGLSLCVYVQVICAFIESSTTKRALQIDLIKMVH